MSHRLTLLTSKPSADRLTPREVDVIELAHLRNREIARELGISPATVKTHMERLLLKLGAESRVAAALAWRDRRAA